jgi:hypothetical protein
MDGDSNFIFHYQIPSNYDWCKLYKFLVVLDQVSNDNEITWNLNQDQSINRRTYP